MSKAASPALSSNSSKAAGNQFDADKIAAKRNSSLQGFRVIARVRPFIATELEGATSENLRSCVEMIDNKTILLNPNDDFAPKAEYAFDESLWSIPSDYKLRRVFADTERKPYASQKTVYECVARGCAELAMEAINSCIMAYGQTGCGKSYSMIGEGDGTNANFDNPDGKEGIIPRVSHDVFVNLDRAKADYAERRSKDPTLPVTTFTVEVTFVEIYMERVRDLLDPALSKKGSGTDPNMKDAKIRLDPESGPFVDGVTKYSVDSWAGIQPLLLRGQSMRRTCATTVHQQSSRSHAVFQLTIVQETILEPKFPGGPPQTARRTGRINLVDLAGSERGGHQDYVKESAQINKSLLTLRRVIDQLVEKQNAFFEKMRQELSATSSPSSSSPAFPPSSPASPATTPSSAIAQGVVPYRESVLTWLLSDSIGGNSCTTMIAALSPHQKNFQETYSTLLWSSKARGLVSVVKVNDVGKSVTSGMGSKLAEMEERLHMQRQNVDIIKQELQLKGEMIQQLEAELVRSREAEAQANEFGDNFVAVAAALTIQRAHLASRQGKSLKKLRQAKGVVEGELAASEDEYHQLVEAKEGLVAALAEETANYGAARRELEETQKQIRRLEAEAGGSPSKASPSSPAAAATAAEISKEQAELSAIRAGVDATRAKTAELQAKELSVEKEKLKRLIEDPVASAQRAEDTKAATALEAENAKQRDAVVDPLRKKKAELEATLKDLNAQLEEKKKKK